MLKLEIGVINNKYPDKDITTSEVAIINEYGTDKIPPRPAFRNGLEKAVTDNKKLVDSALKNIANHLLTGRKDALEKNLNQVLTQIGRSAKKNIKDTIKNGSQEPGNAQTTIDKKGFDHPLFETGLLLDSVEYQVSKE